MILTILISSIFVNNCQSLLLVNTTNKIIEKTNFNVSNTIIGLFDVISDVTKNSETLFDQFEDGFDTIQQSNETDFNSTEETSDQELDGSSFVVNSFNIIKDATKTFGDILGDLEVNLSDRREDVEDIAMEVDDKFQNIGSDVGRDIIIEISHHPKIIKLKKEW